MKAAYYNSNGKMATLRLDARTVLGAKREAYRRATGEQNEIVLTDDSGEPIAVCRTSTPLNNFAREKGRWENA